MKCSYNVPENGYWNVFAKKIRFYSFMNTLVVIFQTTTMFKLLILLFIMNFFEILKVWPFNTLHENKNFRLTKICEKDRKDHIFISFLMFPFQGNIIFSELSFKRKCKKAASFRKCVFLRKYEIFVYDSCA